MSPKTLGYFGTTRSVDSVLQTVFFFVQREIENHIIDLCLFFYLFVEKSNGATKRSDRVQLEGDQAETPKKGACLSLSLSLSLTWRIAL